MKYPKLSKLKTLALFLTLLILNQIFVSENFGQRKESPNAVGRKPPEIVGKTLTPAQKLRLETFRIVWQTINDNYFDRTFNGLNWNKIKTEYEPQVVKLETDAELHVLLQKMIDRLNRSHFSIISPEVIYALERAKEKAKAEGNELSEKNDDEDEETDEKPEEAAGTYGIGVGLRVLNGQLVIVRVESGSAAEKADLKTGFVIEKINSVSLETLIETVDSAGNKGYKKQLPLIIEAFFLNGERDVPVMLEYLDGDDQPQKKIIKREKLSGESVKIQSNLPYQFVRFEAESFDDDTGYIRFNFFAVSVIDKFCGAIGKFKNKKNLIIDLRGNLGGNLGTLWGITSLLTDKTIKLGTEINKDKREDRFIKPQKKHFKGRIVVLVDNLSYSAAEMFAAALQENGLATVIGETSAGEALPAVTTILPTGAVFLYPVANFETPKGNLLEGIGVKPDLNVKLERKTLLSGIDKQIESALAFFKTEPAQKKSLKSIASNALKNVAPPAPPPRPANSPAEKPRPKIVVKQDAKALRVIDDFIAKTGGKNAYQKITSYTANGTVTLNRAGAKVFGTIGIYRDSPNKLAEIYEFEGISKIAEVFDGNNFFAQTTILGTDDAAPPAYVYERKLFSEFNEMIKMRELYPQITFLGEFERDGEQVQIVQAVSNEGVKVIFGFDAKTKFLIFRSGTYGDMTFGDYQKVGDILFPFYQTRSNIFEFNFIDVNLNEKPDASVFLPEESCYDKTE